MYPLKKFIQGPNLHDESVTRNHDLEQANYPKIETFTGEQAKKVYEDVINMPSNHMPQSSSQVRKAVQKTLEKAKETKLEKLTFNQLLRLCEADDHQKLRKYIQEYYSEMNLDEKDYFGWTMLMSSACAGANGTVQLLLEAGADWTILDKKGLSACELAKKKGKMGICNIIQEWEEFVRNPNASPDIIVLDSDQDGEISSDPIYCQACDSAFSNQKEHLKSISHLFSSGEMRAEGDKVHYGIPESNRGFQIMLRTGWNKSRGLGPGGQGAKFPVKTVLKRGREGVGNPRDKKAARITHFAPYDPAVVANHNPSRTERAATRQKREEVQRQGKERRKEIHLRRQLGQLD